MNFKIENNNLDITNYPSVEKHLEDMARQGWLIKKIILESIFIYKRIEPEDLDFSISPYEVETTFTKKSKKDLNEFKSVCESVGWNYATKALNFHIYFKEEGSDSIDIQTDEEEEFRSIETMGKKLIGLYYMITPIFLYICWYVFRDLIFTVGGMKDGLGQIIAPLLAATVVFNVIHLMNLKRFLKENNENIELGKKIEFSDSKFYFYRFIFLFRLVTLCVFVVYSLVNIVLFKNKILLMSLVVVLLSMIVGVFYSTFIKPSKIKLKNKKIGFFLTIVATIFITTILIVFRADTRTDNTKDLNLMGYKILIIDDLEAKAIEGHNVLRQNMSILIPKSYEYYSFTKGHGSISTEYSKASTKHLAKILVNRYKKQTENLLKRRYLNALEYSFKQGWFDSTLLHGGLIIEDFADLKDKDIKEAKIAAIQIMKTRNIVEDIENLWNLDEVYYLNYDKKEVVLRKGKEVFYLAGKDFTDIEVIKIVKEKLGLDYD